VKRHRGVVRGTGPLARTSSPVHRRILPPAGVATKAVRSSPTARPGRASTSRSVFTE